MVTYLELHPAKVQTYISRWSDLRGRRGASTMLRNVFASEAFNRLCSSAGIVVNDHAVLTEGSVSVVVESDDNAVITQIAETLVSWARTQCPAAEFSIIAATAEEHGEEGYFASNLASQASRGNVQPASASCYEVPLLARCAVTGSDCAVGVAGVPIQKRRIGADAAERLETGAFRTAEERRNDQRNPDEDASALGIEARLGRDLGFEADCKSGFGAVADFADLARQGPGGHKRNHLATVYCDGNSIGSLMHETEISQRHGISIALTRAAQEALLATGKRVIGLCGTSPTADQPALSITPHILGGDDVLLTVPAAVGLLAAETFCRTFGEQSPPGASASAAVVFHHFAFPFPMISETAANLLRLVKRAHETSSAFGVIDITRDGGIVGSSLPTMTFEEIEDRRADLDWLASLGKSARAQLESAVKLDEPLVARSRLLLIAIRNKDLAHRAALVTDVDWLRNALPITHWWMRADGKDAG